MRMRDEDGISTLRGDDEGCVSILEFQQQGFSLFTQHFRGDVTRDTGLFYVASLFNLAAPTKPGHR